MRDLVNLARRAFENGENVIEVARTAGLDPTTAALLAYDLQAGVYVEMARTKVRYRERRCAQIASYIKPFAPRTVLEVGVGEATTLGLVASHFDAEWFGFDISWSRIDVGRAFLAERGVRAELFVADLFRIPLADESVDVVYSSHSLEPNGGREREAIAESLRVARRAVVLIEPIYELSPPEVQARMRERGYVRGLREAAGNVTRYELLPADCSQARNPSGVLVLEKEPRPSVDVRWQCPITGAPLLRDVDVFVAPGIAYPILRGIPLLRPEHAVIASRLTHRYTSPATQPE